MIHIFMGILYDFYWCSCIRCTKIASWKIRFVLNIRGQDLVSPYDKFPSSRLFEIWEFSRRRENTQLSHEGGRWISLDYFDWSLRKVWNETTREKKLIYSRVIEELVKIFFSRHGFYLLLRREVHRENDDFFFVFIRTGNVNPTLWRFRDRFSFFIFLVFIFYIVILKVLV